MLAQINFILHEIKAYTCFGGKHYGYNRRISPYHVVLGANTAFFESTFNHIIIVKLNSELGSPRWT